MIYTIGFSKNYDKGLRKYGRKFLKMGENKKSNYPGGFAFKTPVDAWCYLAEVGKKGYSVYKIKANWEMDTAPSVAQGGWWHRLLVDRPILRKVPRPRHWRKLVAAAIAAAPPVEGDPG